MDQTQIKQVLGELQKDQKFKADFLNNPVDSLKKKGYSLTSDQEKKLKSMGPGDLRKKTETGMMANDCSYHLCGS
jgi:hypothetical protein